MLCIPAIAISTILTGSTEDLARNYLLQFSRVVQHGLVPNLYDPARYNARDATWFFLVAIDRYCSLHNDSSLFKELESVVERILLAHRQGIHFVDTGMDDRMTHEGFQIDITYDASSGLLRGGNTSNAGTWMDKMGSSHRAGNHGKPATPRDGAPIEISAGLFVALRMMCKWGNPASPHRTLWDAWLQKVKDNVEKLYWFPDRGIYKDVLFSTVWWHEIQLRPNACVALSFAPELFDADHARQYLEAVRTKLVWNDFALRTLDPEDWNYRPFYRNAEDSDDFWSALGMNYHNGPAWVWLYGHYVIARLHFFPEERTPEALRAMLTKHAEHLRHSIWGGLPELVETNDGCPTQAWSAACVLEALHYAKQLGIEYHDDHERA
jgi:glycogen debranching enzyme